MKQARLALLVAGFFALLFLQKTDAQSCTGNLLLNPGFESNLANWEGTGGVVLPTGGAFGTKAVELCVGGSLRQTKATTAGKTLVFQFGLYSSGPNPTTVLTYIKYLNSSFTPITTEFFTATATLNGFINSSVTKLSPTGTAWVEAGFLKETSGCTKIDNCCLSENSGGNPCSPDVAPPVISGCPANITVTTPNTTVPVSWIPPTAIDNCSAVTTSSSFSPGFAFQAGVPMSNTPVDYAFLDVAGNVALCNFTITAIQQTGGGGTCTGNLLQNGGFENNLNNWEGSGGVISTTASAGTKSIKLCLNNNLRQTLSTQAGKNLTLLFKARTETTGANKVLSYIKFLNSSFTPLVTEFFDFSTTATFSQATVSKLAPTGAAWAEIGFLKQTAGCVLVDEVCLSEGGGGNPCSPDVTAPVISNCPASQNLTTTGTSATANWTAPTATDACSAVTFTNNFSSGASFPLGATTVNFTAKDAANNMATCSFVVNVTQTGGGGSCSFVKNYKTVDPNSFTSTFIGTQIEETASGLATWYTTYSANFQNSSFQVFSTNLTGNLTASPIVASPTLAGQINSVRLTTGDFVSVLDIGPTPSFQYSPAFRKINSAGTTVWQNNLPTYSPTTATGTTNGNGIMADGADLIGAFTFVDNSNSNNPINETVLIKINAGGATVWIKKLPFSTQFNSVFLKGTTANGFFVVTNGPQGQRRVSKIDRSTGNVLWDHIIPVTPGSSFSPDLPFGTVLSDGNLAVFLRTGSILSEVYKINGSTGAAITALPVSLLDITQISYNDFFSTNGMLATADGGFILSTSANQPFNPSTPRIMKINASLILDWVKILPADWKMSAQKFAADGGILMTGLRGDDFGIAKLTATGDLAPVCANSCHINTVSFTNLVCNNNGTDSNPSDDTFTFSANLTSAGTCTGGWTTLPTGAGATTGSYGVAKTVVGGLIAAGVQNVQFADAANPASTIYSIKIVPPAFCSNTATGCGFDKTYGTNSVNMGFVTGPRVENLAGSGFKVSNEEPFFSPPSKSYSEISIDATGTQTNFFTEPITGNRIRTLDGQYIGASFSSTTNIVLTKGNAAGTTTVFTKNVAFSANGATSFFQPPAVISVISIPDGYVILGGFDTQATPSSTPERFPFLIKTDLLGNKLFQNIQPADPSYPHFSGDFFQGASGNFYYVRNSLATLFLNKVSSTGTKLWETSIMSDFPSSDQFSIHEASDGHVFTTRYDNSFGYVRKLDAASGTQLWQFSSSTLPIPNNSTVFGFPRGSISTTDGGAVFSMGYSFPGGGNPANGYVYGRLSSGGQLMWHKILADNTILQKPIAQTPDGGFLFAGLKSSSGSTFGIFKTTSLGDLTPTCGGSNQPDLTLQNLTTTQTSVAVGAVLNFKFDLKNIGTAAATGNFTIKSYLSTDNVLSANDLQNGSVPTGNLAAGATVFQVMGALTVPAGTAAGNYFLILKVDADNQISESNENNNVLASASTISVTTGGQAGADLKITITADKTTVPQWGNVTFTITAKNEGTAPISSAVLKVGGCAAGVFQNFDGNFKLVYAGTPPPATVGNFNFVAQEWTISNLAAGAQGILTLPLFTTSTAEKKVAAWSKTQSPTDPDSQPSASIFGNCTPVQDDEAVFTINSGQSGQAVSPLSNGNPAADLVHFSIFPNPTDGQTSLDVSYFLDKKIDVAVSDAFGRVVYLSKNNDVKTATIDLDLSRESNGVYFIKIDAEGYRSVVKRLIISKL